MIADSASGLSNRSDCGQIRRRIGYAKSSTWDSICVYFVGTNNKTKNRTSVCSRRKGSSAVSPTISTVILTGVIIVTILAATTFANRFLDSRMAENEFESMKQFMETVGFQIDDVAWTIGRTQTIRYASRYGTTNFESGALNYTVFVQSDTTWKLVLANATGIILFNMPISKYSLGNNYFERIFPSSDGSILQKGTSAPVNHIFTVERFPMQDGGYIRVVVAPSIRVLNSTIRVGSETRNYFRFFLLCLERGSQPSYSQSITITGKGVTKATESEVDAIRINVTFPNEMLGFDSRFFNFKSIMEDFDLPGDSIVEFYLAEVQVSLSR